MDARNYIDGSWCEGSSDDVIDVTDPATEHEFTRVKSVVIRTRTS